MAPLQPANLNSFQGGKASAASHSKKKKPATPFAVKPISAFYVFLGANFLAALYAPIQDCDETFNYWEPTHYLSHGYGLQTWEYSPDYAIRSWLYITIHALIGNFRRLLPFPTKLGEFYFSWVLPCLSIFLPSSFAMYTTMLGMAAFMNWRGGLKTAQGIFWFAVGGILGWPFSMALSAPFLIEEVIFASLSDKDAIIDTVMRFLRGVVGGLVVLIYSPLQNGTIGSRGDSVCFAKEWYRFPSSYHLPHGMKARFVKSEFDGLLPGEFSEASEGFGIWSGAWLVPSGMNDRNLEDMSKYVDLKACNFLVDTYYPGSVASELEPHYIKDTENWES
ncbi:hypothetical protein DID88_000173 [Monilinia fructigena]|uniref:Mannosyltransferase n=1 Tax=Monilinia fructigena TaxID=38457 RepID=A0A395ILJ8_9HELO|nr:hypothetical protein DID88_000173 [Monilinia fructigena]